MNKYPHWSVFVCMLGGFQALTVSAVTGGAGHCESTNAAGD